MHSQKYSPKAQDATTPWAQIVRANTAGKKQRSPKTHKQPSKIQACFTFLLPVRSPTDTAITPPSTAPAAPPLNSLCAPPLMLPPSLPDLARPISRGSSSLPSRSHTLPKPLTERQTPARCSASTPPSLLAAAKCPSRWWAQAARDRRRFTALLVTQFI